MSSVTKKIEKGIKSGLGPLVGIPFSAPTPSGVKGIGEDIKKLGTTLGGKPSESTPQLFTAEQLRTPEEKRAFQRTTPLLVERGIKGVDPQERRRLKKRAFEDIGASTKTALGNLREIFGRTGVRGGVQGADIADIIEASIGAKGAASTAIEGQVKADAQQQLQNLLALLSQQAPFAVAQQTTGRKKGALEIAKEGVDVFTGATGTTPF